MEIEADVRKQIRQQEKRRALITAKRILEKSGFRVDDTPDEDVEASRSRHRWYIIDKEEGEVEKPRYCVRCGEKYTPSKSVDSFVRVCPKCEETGKEDVSSEKETSDQRQSEEAS